MIKPAPKIRHPFAPRQLHPDRFHVPPRWLGGPGAQERLAQMQRELDEIARNA